VKFSDFVLLWLVATPLNLLFCLLPPKH